MRFVWTGMVAALVAAGVPAKADTVNITKFGTNNTIATPNPNGVLRYYVVATGSNGTSVFSLGEIDPAFAFASGTAATTANSPYVSTTGSSLSLLDPNAGASGRNVSN